MWVSQRSADLDLDLPTLDHSRLRPQGDWWVGPASEPPHLNVLTTTDAVARYLVLRYTHDVFASYSAKEQTLAGKVATLSREGDGRVVRATIRDDVVFSDGSPLLAEDLEFVLRAGHAPGSQFGSARGACSMIKSIEVVGPRECLFSFDDAKGIGALLSFPIVQARHYRESIAELARAKGQAPPADYSAEFSALLAQVRLPGPGTGPYMLAREKGSGAVAWRAGSHLYLVQNTRSWRRTAEPHCFNLMGIGLRFLSDPAAQVTALRQGQIDWYSGDDAPQLIAQDSALAARMRLLEYDAEHLGHHMVIWNMRRKPLDDVRVRRALSKLFDRMAIVAKLMYGHGRVAAAWSRPSDPHYPPDLPPVAFDPAAARAELREAGVVVDGAPAPKLEILVANQLSLHRRIVEQALPAFAAAGIDLQIQAREWGEVIKRCDTRDFDAVLMNWSHSGYGAPLPWILHSRELASPGRNYSGLNSPEFDAALDQVFGKPADGQELIPLYHKLAHLLRDLEPVSLLAHPKAVLLIAKRYEGVEPGAAGVVMDKFWVPDSAK